MPSAQDLDTICPRPSVRRGEHAGDACTGGSRRNSLPNVSWRGLLDGAGAGAGVELELSWLAVQPDHPYLSPNAGNWWWWYHLLDER
jgi:hypothetical protein